MGSQDGPDDDSGSDCREQIIKKIPQNHTIDLEAESTRDTFLIEMYKQLWASLDRIEGGMWSFIAAYAAIAVSVLLGISNESNLFFSLLFSIIVSFWGMNISIVSWKWTQRNIQQVSNIEHEFLDDEDLNNILPRKYVTSDSYDRLFTNSSSEVLNFLAFLSALAFTTGGYFAVTELSINSVEFLSIYAVISGGMLVTVWNYKKSIEELNRFFRETEGQEQELGILFTTFLILNQLAVFITLILIQIMTSSNGKRTFTIFNPFFWVVALSIIVTILILFWVDWD